MSEAQRKVLAEVQRLPLVPRPFEEVAKRLRMSEAEVMQQCILLLEKGVIRRFGPSVNHRELGYGANPMTVMKVSGERVDDVGKMIALEPEVTHCYSRSGWDYNLFFMVHARTREEGEEKAKAIANKTGIEDYKLLFSIKEFKKVSFELPRGGGSA